MSGTTTEHEPHERRRREACGDAGRVAHDQPETVGDRGGAYPAAPERLLPGLRAAAHAAEARAQPVEERPHARAHRDDHPLHHVEQRPESRRHPLGREQPPRPPPTESTRPRIMAWRRAPGAHARHHVADGGHRAREGRDAGVVFDARDGRDEVGGRLGEVRHCRAEPWPRAWAKPPRPIPVRCVSRDRMPRHRLARDAARPPGDADAGPEGDVGLPRATADARALLRWPCGCP